MTERSGSVFLAGQRVRLFKRQDRPSRFFQAAFRLPGKARPLVKSTGQADLAAAKRWALDFLAHLLVREPVPVSGGPAVAGMRENLLAPYPFPKIRQEKRHVERELALRVLAAYRHDPLLSQRRLGQALNISLAVVNAYTGRCVRARWLLKLQRPRGRGSGYRYALTETGRRQLDDLLRAYVAQELSFYRRLKAAFVALLTAQPRHDIILAGSGDMAEIAGQVLSEHAIKPLLVVPSDRLADLARAAAKRRRRTVLWLVDPGQSEAIRAAAAHHLPDMPILSPDLLGALA